MLHVLYMEFNYVVHHLDLMKSGSPLKLRQLMLPLIGV
jgi:hypothetical protein